jgi:DNA mismatch repair ATPase MutS
MVLTAESVLAMWWRPRVREVIFSVERPGRELALLAKLLARLEKEPFQSPRLIELQRSLETEGIAASKQIARLGRRIDMLDARRNQLFAPLAALLMWGTQFAFALERWRRKSGATVEKLLASIGEMEALLALATYSYEHPADPFPVLVEEGPLFEGRGLGHPLLPEERLVRNDVNLGKRLRLLVVSGSNMSGKSTLLRTVGTNSVLALCGAPVRATRLRLSPLAVGASIRILDSLQEGVSRFYAEIKRLRQIMDMSNGPLPLVFLMDEILHGTNSHDRRIGAEAVVRGLVERGAVGLMTTHDLALSRVADGLAPDAANVHFEDHLEDGKMVFDYQLHDGPCPTTNALEIMRLEGLPVDGEGA